MEELKVLYEDNHIIVVEKPQNIPTQADVSGDLDMLTMVKNYIKEKYNKPGNVYVGLVHRLDRPTGGILVFAKTSKAAGRLCEQIKEKSCKKKYLAVTVNVPRFKEGKLENYLSKDEKTNIVTVVPQGNVGAKYALLNYNVLGCKATDKNVNIALCDVDLQTGRSHQIRVQFAHIKCSLFGDKKYGGDITPNHNLALWAYELRFVHPVTKQNMVFKSMPPINNTPWKFFEKEITAKF